MRRPFRSSPSSLGQRGAVLLEAVERSIRQQRLFHRGQSILVAVSGGVDSVVLLHVLTQLAPRQGWKLRLAHLNHQLRGRSSLADERLVRLTAIRLGLPRVVERAPVREFARQYRLSTEMAARRLRHEFLARAAIQHGCSCIALAHHAEDQLELFFLRLLRGAGSEGLAGMKWANPSPSNPQVRLVRPLLDQPKGGLRDYAIAHHLDFREDATNAALNIQRNRIRHELLPLLRRQYQPGLDKTVLRLMNLLEAESDFVRHAALAWLGAPTAGATPFDSLPTAVQRRCLQLQLLQLGVPPEFDLIEALRHTAGRRVSVGEAHIERDAQGQVRLHPGTPSKPIGEVLDLRLRGRAGETCFDGTRIGWKLLRRPGAGAVTRRPRQELFDADQVGPEVRLRHWQPGDRFQPIGMSAPVKIQDIFTNQKVPRARRYQLVLAESRNAGIFWVEGLRIGERFKLTQQTIRRLQWRWQRL